ncbi:MAG: biotin--[acetyl-CoA-carboxylase] ligase [Clostridia bacterium]
MNRDQAAEEQLQSYLADCGFFKNAECYTLLTSTNDRCRELAAGGAPEGTVVLAESQTAGRGRMGRRFYSPSGDGLYMSILLRPAERLKDLGLLTACAAVAVREAIRTVTGVAVDIKWVNDLYYHNKKLCGILAEGQFDSAGAPAYMILGIGVNLRPPAAGYAAEIRGKTVSLAEMAPGTATDRLILCAAVLRQLAGLYQALPDRGFLQIYRDASCVLGKTVRYEQNGQPYTARAVAIDDQARLVVRRADDTEIALGTGEISLLRPVL